MNYQEIIDLALVYSDRQDTALLSVMDNFLRIVESRVNRQLSIQKQVIRTSLLMEENKEYYGLPADFKALRDIETYSVESPQNKSTLYFRTPEQMNAIEGGSFVGSYYNIIANQLHVLPPNPANMIEIAYYRKLPALTSTDSHNWISDDNPDVYVFGLMVEISSFVKDAEAARLWDSRFITSVKEVSMDDAVDRWSGTPLSMRLL